MEDQHRQRARNEADDQPARCREVRVLMFMVDGVSCHAGPPWGHNAMANALQEMRLLAIARFLDAGAARAVPLRAASPPAGAAGADAAANGARAGCAAC